VAQAERTFELTCYVSHITSFIYSGMQQCAKYVVVLTQCSDAVWRTVLRAQTLTATD